VYDAWWCVDRRPTARLKTRSRQTVAETFFNTKGPDWPGLSVFKRHQSAVMGIWSARIRDGSAGAPTRSASGLGWMLTRSGTPSSACEKTGHQPCSVRLRLRRRQIATRLARERESACSTAQAGHGPEGVRAQQADTERIAPTLQLSNGRNTRSLRWRYRQPVCRASCERRGNRATTSGDDTGSVLYCGSTGFMRGTRATFRQPQLLRCRAHHHRRAIDQQSLTRIANVRRTTGAAARLAGSTLKCRARARSSICNTRAPRERRWCF
jgi:hypothetical protein